MLWNAQKESNFTKTTRHILLNWVELTKDDTYSILRSWLLLLLCHCLTLPPAQHHTPSAWHLRHTWFVAYQNQIGKQKTSISLYLHPFLPMLVAPASMLFSTSSLTAVAKVSTTCPEQIWCTECLSMALMARAGSELLRRKQVLSDDILAKLYLLLNVEWSCGARASSTFKHADVS